MEKLLQTLPIVLFVLQVFLLSCKRELSCERCNQTNQPPTAAAGPDQAITLPTDSALLDGSRSSDPDGKISAWQWTKVAGPASFTFSNNNTSKASVHNLKKGTYQFELKVTDEEGASAKDTVLIKVDSLLDSNHPPFACAGNDLIVTLPDNTTTLDGGCSTDPDNNITGYSWKKIAGPAAFYVANENAAQTQLTNLAEGVYQFELTVADAGGLFAKDTVQVKVQAAPSTLCANDSVRAVRGAATISLLGNLSEARLILPVAAADKLVFNAGIRSYNPVEGDAWSSYQIDIYNFSTHAWSASKGHKSLLDHPMTAITGSNIVYNSAFGLDIYNASTDNWQWDLQMPTLKANDVMGVVGDKVFYPGDDANTISSRIDVYDIATKSWSIASLSEPRIHPLPVTISSRLFFAGGFTKANDTARLDKSKRCDIYNAATQTWSTTDMPVAAQVASAAGAGNKIVLSLDGFPDKVFIYDFITNGWAEHSLSVPRLQWGKVMAIGNKILVAEDGNYSTVTTVDVYDATKDAWSTTNVGHSCSVYWFGTSGNKLVMMTQAPHMHHSSDTSNYIFTVYDAATDTWSELEMSYCFFAWPTLANGSLIIGGGETNAAGKYEYTAKVWEIKF